jgi:hypothetical protein
LIQSLQKYEIYRALPPKIKPFMLDFAVCEKPVDTGCSGSFKGYAIALKKACLQACRVALFCTEGLSS